MVLSIQERDPNDIFEKFTKRGQPEFYGTEDKKIFKVYEWTDHQRLQLANYMFRSIAEDRWRTVEGPYELLEDEIVWDTFKAKLMKKFILAYIHKQKFKDLVQGDVTVQHYELRLTHLSLSYRL